MHSRIYQITKNKTDWVSEQDMTDSISYSNIDYVGYSDNREDDLKWLKEGLGLDIVKNEKGDDVLVVTKEGVIDYFKPKYEEAVKMMEGMSLETFASSSFERYKLSSVIYGKGGFLVCFEDGSYEDIGEWISGAKEGEYIIGAIFDYHW